MELLPGGVLFKYPERRANLLKMSTGYIEK